MLASRTRAARCLGAIALFTACAAACAPSTEIVVIPPSTPRATRLVTSFAT